MSEEVWKEVPGYNGKYLVSSKGNVKNAKTGRLLTQSHYGVDKNYRSVNLSINGVGYSLGVHRLVATAFVDNPGIFTEVHHLDSNPTNNNASNLSWVSRLENIGSKEGNHKINIINGNNILKTFNSMNELSRKLSVSKSLLNNILKPVNSKDYTMTKNEYDMAMMHGDELYSSYVSKINSLNGQGKNGRNRGGKIQRWVDSLSGDRLDSVKYDVDNLSRAKFKAKWNKDKRYVEKYLDIN